MYSVVLHMFPFTVIDFCLFEVFRPIWEFCTLLETSAWTVKVGNFLPMLALMAMSNKVSLACHTYCDTGHPFIMVISENPSHLAFGRGAVTVTFLTNYVRRSWDLNTERSTCGVCTWYNNIRCWIVQRKSLDSVTKR